MKCSCCGSKIPEDSGLKCGSQILCKKCFFKNEKISTRRERAIKQVTSKLLPLSDTISLIVTGHLIIEYWLDWFIGFMVRDPKKLLDSAHLSFSQKLCIAESFGIGEECSVAIRLLNNIRNYLSHNLDYQITSKDLKVFQTFSPSLSKKQQSEMDMLGSPKKELITFCVYFAGYISGWECNYVGGINR